MIPDRLSCALAAAVVMLAADGGAAQMPWSLMGRIETGPFEAGFTVLETSDPSRADASGAERRIQIAVWYPAKRTPGAAPPSYMRYNEYVRLNTTERTLVPASADEERATLVAYRDALVKDGIPRASATAWMNIEMTAVRNAEPAAGRFPVVFVAQGERGAAQDQALLAEYLASYGWVVATSPAPGRLGPAAEGPAALFLDASQQARDLAEILSRLGSFPSADTRRLAVVGYSSGARSALLFALRDPRVLGLVSIDGGIGNRIGRDWLRGAPLDARTLATPLLHFFEDADDAMVPDLQALAALHRSDRMIVKVSGMRHADFTTLGMARAVVAGVAGAGAPSVPDRALETRFGGVLRYIRAFLEARLEGSDAEAAFLAEEPSAHGLGAAFPRIIRMKPSAPETKRRAPGGRPRVSGSGAGGR